MAKKLIAFMLVLLCTVSVVWGFSYVKKTGMLEPYPEAEYLTGAEEEMRPFYRQLTRKEKAVYTAMYRGVSEGNLEISLPYEIDGDMYSKLYCLLEKQEGELFYVDSTYYTAMKLREAKIILRDENENQYDEMSKRLDDKADEILSGIPYGADDFETALYIHDYIVENCVYEIDEEGYNATAYGCIVEGKAHCEGYAKAFGYLSRKAGLECVTVTGITDEGENHAWNQIEISGKWYNLDVTWDDADSEAYNLHIYFLCSDDEFGDTHFADNMFFEALTCKENSDNYYIRNDLYVNDKKDGERILEREIKQQSDFVELKFADKKRYDDFVEEYLRDEEIFEIIMEYGGFLPGENITISMKEYENELCIVLDMPEFDK